MDWRRINVFANLPRWIRVYCVTWYHGVHLNKIRRGVLLGSQMNRNETAISLSKPWIRGGLPADPGLLFLISYIGIAFHALAYGAQVAAILINNFTASLHSLTRGMTRPPAPPIGLKVEEAMTSAEIDAELFCPLRTPNFPPGTHDYDPKAHDRIEGVSECMISGKEAQAKFNEFREAQEWWSLHWWLQNERESGGSGGHQPPFQEWWDNLPPTVQKTARQQHYHFSWGYSHQSGTELLPTHGPSPSWCGSLLWLNVLFAGNWGWRHREPFYLPYHEPALVIEWQGHTCSFLLGTKPLWHWRKWKSGPTSKRPSTKI